MIFYNLLSLVLGLAAWLLPFLFNTHRGMTVPFSSFSCCCVSLVLQFYSLRYRVLSGDYAGIGDTIGAVCFAAVAVTLGTIAANSLRRLRHKKQQAYGSPR